VHVRSAIVNTGLYLYLLKVFILPEMRHWRCRSSRAKSHSLSTSRPG